VRALADLARQLCTAYRALAAATAPAATKSDTIPVSADGVLERTKHGAAAAANDVPQRTEPVSEPQHNDALGGGGGAAAAATSVAAPSLVDRAATRKRRYTRGYSSSSGGDVVLDSEDATIAEYHSIGQIKRF
jgi:hypothetical protein